MSKWKTLYAYNGKFISEMSPNEKEEVLDYLLDKNRELEKEVNKLRNDYVSLMKSINVVLG